MTLNPSKNSCNLEQLALKGLTASEGRWVPHLCFSLSMATLYIFTEHFIVWSMCVFQNVFHVFQINWKSCAVFFRNCELHMQTLEASFMYNFFPKHKCFGFWGIE